MRILKSLPARAAQATPRPPTAAPGIGKPEKMPVGKVTPAQNVVPREFPVKTPVIYLKKIDSKDPIPNNLTERRMRQSGSVMLAPPKSSKKAAVVVVVEPVAEGEDDDTQLIEDEDSQQGSQTTVGSQPREDEVESTQKRRRRRRRQRQLKYSRLQTIKKKPLLSLALHKAQFKKLLKEIRATEKAKLCLSSKIKTLEGIETKLSKKYYDVSGITVRYSNPSHSNDSKDEQEDLLESMQEEIVKLVNKISVKTNQLEIERAQLQRAGAKRSAAASCCNYCSANRK